MTDNQLWSRWTIANALGEMVGLGLTFLITGLFFTWGILLSFCQRRGGSDVRRPGAVVGDAAGAVVGAIHGLFLVRLVDLQYSRD